MSSGEVLQQAFGPTLGLIFQAFIFSLFIIVPIALMIRFWRLWVTYVRAAFFASQKYIVLELKIPKGITKSPLAMELFITALHQTGGEGTIFDRYWLGKTRPWFSLEIASIEGNVRFFIWTREGFRDLIESQLYGQFSDIEINRIDDYATSLNFNWNDYQMWACDFKKSKDSHLPIKTYTSFGLDKDPKEEIKIDPITATIEFLGSLGRGQQVWIQIGIRAHKEEITKPGTWFEKVDWKYAAQEEIKKLMKRDDKAKKEGAAPPGPLTKGESERVEMIEKSIAKLAFDTGIRAIYVARKDSYNAAYISGVSGAFRQYNSTNLNGFGPQNGTAYDYPWQDFTGAKLMKKKEKMMFLYRNRSFFYPEFFPGGYSYKPFVMNTEELATIYHFPGDVSRTPTLSRISAKRAEPPANLPI